MAQLLWDASALVKRYSLETGSDTVDALFQVTPPLPMVVTHLGYVESCASQRRKVNQGAYDLTTFTNARSALRAEVVVGPRFHLLTVDESVLFASIALIDQYRLNASDAIALLAYRRYARSQPPEASPFLLVTADHRLLRAAAVEGLHTLDPERFPAADVPAFLAAL